MQAYTPNLFTYVVMFGFLPYSVYLFRRLPTRIAIIAVVVTGWIFLPQAQFEIPHIPFHTKINAISMAVLLGILIRDPGFFRNLRFSCVDIPLLCWCVSPFFSSVSNDLGVYDGINGIEYRAVDYAIPYVLGRLYLGTHEGIRDLGVGMLLGALVLLPLVVIELIISPQLHTWVYGWYPHDFSQTVRDGGFRPSVFMSHGLELAIWNAAAAFVGWEMFLRKAIPKVLPLLRLPTLPSLITLTAVFAISHSTGAIVLFLIAMLMFHVTILMKTRLPLIFLMLIPLLYMNLRGTGAWDGKSLLEITKKATGSADRVNSLDFRLQNEDLLLAKARLRLNFGWGEYRRSFVTDDAGSYISVPDGKWIVVLGANGLFGLTAFTIFMLLPAFLFVIKCPVAKFATPLVVAEAAFATFLCITTVDNLFNGMENPVLILAVGGLSTLALAPRAKFATSEDEIMSIARSPALATTRPI